jgi:hypothetical protein
MQNGKRALLVARRAIAIVQNREYDEDAVCHMLEHANEDLEEEGWRLEDTELSEAA